MLKYFFKTRPFLLLFALTIFSVACRNDNKEESEETPQYFLKANFNGELKTFQGLFSYGFSLDGNGQPTSINLSYNVSKQDGSPYPGIFLDIAPNYNPGEIFKTGTYNEENDNVRFEYRKSQTDFSTASKYTPKDFTFTITQFGNKRIKGTFNGKLQNEVGETIVVTNGEFYGYGD